MKLDTAAFERVLRHARTPTDPPPAEWDYFLRIAQPNAWQNASGAMRGTAAPERRNFATEYEASWRQFFENLAVWPTIDEAVGGIRNLQRVLLTPWFCPELPRAFRWAMQANVLLLVGDDAPWLQPMRDAACTLNVQAERAMSDLERQMADGRAVAATLDDAYGDPAAMDVALLGTVLRMPSAILTLAARHGYSLHFVTPRDGRLQVTQSVEAAGQTPIQLAKWYTGALESEVRVSLSRWLSWYSARTSGSA